MIDTSPQKIKKTIGMIYAGNGEHTINQLIDELIELRGKYSETYSKIVFDINWNEDEWGHPMSVSIDIIGERLESAGESATRILNEEKREKLWREQRYEEYLRLKKMFEEND